MMMQAMESVKPKNPPKWLAELSDEQLLKMAGI
jgi:hypothetical protein